MRKFFFALLFAAAALTAVSAMGCKSASKGCSSCGG